MHSFIHHQRGKSSDPLRPFYRFYPHLLHLLGLVHMFTSLLYVCIARLELKSPVFLRGFRTEGGRSRRCSLASPLAPISFLLEGFRLLSLALLCASVLVLCEEPRVAQLRCSSNCEPRGASTNSHKDTFPRCIRVFFFIGRFACWSCRSSLYRCVSVCVSVWLAGYC